MTLGRIVRRDALRLAAALPVLAAATTARAAQPPNVVLFCDRSLQPPMRAAAAAFRRAGGPPVDMLSVPAALLAAQLARGERDDVLVTLAPTVADCVAQGLVTAAAIPGWSNPVVLAGAGDGPLAVPDPTPYAVFDGAGALAALGRTPPSTLGAVDTSGVAWLVARGQAASGLMLASDAAGAGLPVRSRLATPAPVYAVALNRHALSPNASRFIDFLGSAPGRAATAALGLESAA